jgi:DNA-binding GntR family transcriptional regulator
MSTESFLLADLTLWCILNTYSDDAGSFYAANHSSAREINHMTRKAGHRRHTPKSSVREGAYLHIQRKIASGELSAGHAISELSLAKELGISRTPIREALGQLAAEGLLEQSPNRRAVVVKLTRQDIIELYELREALEMYAVGKAARQRVRQADLDRLQSLNDAILTLRDELQRLGKSGLDREQMHRFVTYDLAFHTLLMRLASNARILKVVNETRVLVRIFAIRRQGHTVPLLEDIHRRHCEVVRAIAEQDPERACTPFLNTFNSARLSALTISTIGKSRPRYGKQSQERFKRKPC